MVEEDRLLALLEVVPGVERVELDWIDDMEYEDATVELVKVDESDRGDELVATDSESVETGNMEVESSVDTSKLEGGKPDDSSTEVDVVLGMKVLLSSTFPTPPHRPASD